MAGESQISESLAILAQRTSGASSGLTTSTDRAAFQRGVRDDLANVLGQLNTIYNPLVTSLHDPVSPKTLDLGLSGNVIYTDIEAIEGSSDVYWFSAESRQYTVKETIDVLLAKFTDLENSVNYIGTPTAFDDTDLWDSITIGNANLSQVVADAFGGDYHLDGDGVANFLYSLAQHVDNIGAQFSGFPGTGLAGYANVYPALTLSAATSPFSVTANVISNTPSSLTNDDFVVGSPTLDYDADPTHASRMFFDKSSGAFRAGYANNTSWNVASLGLYSVSFGYRSTAGGSSSVAIGYENSVSGSNVNYSGITAGRSNGISESQDSVIGGGYGNNMISTDGTVYYRNTISGGGLNTIEAASYASIGGGRDNTIGTTGVWTDGNTVAGGYSNIISNTIAHDYGFIGGGSINILDGVGTHAVIVGGYNNNISGASVEYTFIGGGEANYIDNSPYSVVTGGGTGLGSNGITDGASSFVGGGGANVITGSYFGVIAGGEDNTITGSGGFGNHAFIGGGGNNDIYVADYGAILYGHLNSVTATLGCAEGEDALANHHGEKAFANAMFATIGDAQTSTVVWKRATVVADGVTPKFLLAGDGSTDYYEMENYSTYLVEVSMVARRTNATGKSAAWTGMAAFARGANAAATALLAGTPTHISAGSVGAPGYTWQFVADTTNGGFQIEVTPTAAPAEDIQWVARIQITKTFNA